MTKKKTQDFPGDARTFLIYHHYDIGDLGVTVRAPEGFDARRAAIYLQLQAEAWFGDEKMVSNLGIAATLVALYGCEHAARSGCSDSIDMYADREAMCCAPEGGALLADKSLARDGLQIILRPHIIG